MQLLPLDIGIHQRRFAVELRIGHAGAQVRITVCKFVLAPQIEPLAPEDGRRAVNVGLRHTVDGLRRDDVLVGLERPPVEVQPHEVPALQVSERKGGVRRHLMRPELMPDHAALARLALPVAICGSGIDRSVLQLHARALRILPDGKSRDAAGREVHVAALPKLQRAVTQTAIEESLIRFGRGADLLGFEFFAVRAHDIDRARGETARMVHHAGREFEVEPRILVTQVLALGIVLRFELHAQAARPAPPQHGRNAAREGIVLADFAARRKFKNIHGIIARFGEHRTAHVAAVEIVVSEAARERDLFQMAHRLGPRAGVPAVVRRRMAGHPAGLLGEIDFGIGAAQAVLPDARGVRAAVPRIAAKNIIETLLCRGA